MIEVLPAPVAPTSATLWPGSTVKSISDKTGGPSPYANDTPSKPTRPSTAAGRTASFGLSTSGFVSSRPKMRSEAAIAACSTLNFSERSEIGRQKRSEYWMKATSAPSVRPPATTCAPP